MLAPRHLALGLSLLAGCLEPAAEMPDDAPLATLPTAPSGPQDTAPEAPQLARPASASFNAAFTGRWMIDQPTHALYEASLYAFGADGTLTFEKTVTYGGQAPDYVTASVARADGVRCVFGTRWTAPATDTWSVEGRCSDSAPRDIVLRFRDETWKTTGGTDALDVVSVGGEAGWAHKDFPWRFVKCLADGSNCKPL